MAEFLEQAIDSRRDRFPYTKLAPEQFRMLDEHLQAATRISRNCVGLIPQGVWEERIDREFDYLSHQIRNVAD